MEEVVRELKWPVHTVAVGVRQFPAGPLEALAGG